MGALGLLGRQLQEETAERLEEAAKDDFDLSFFGVEDILKLIPPTRLVALGVRLRVETLVAAPERISSIADDADMDEDAESNFENYSKGLELLEEITELDDETKELVERVREAISEGTKTIVKKQEERDNPDYSDWDYMSTASRQTVTKPATLPKRDKIIERSIFEDVDRS